MPRVREEAPGEKGMRDLFIERAFEGIDFPTLEESWFSYCTFHECTFLGGRRCRFSDCKFTSCDLKLFIDTFVNGCVFVKTSLPIIGTGSLANSNLLHDGEIIVPPARFDCIDQLLNYFKIVPISAGDPVIRDNVARPA